MAQFVRKYGNDVTRECKSCAKEFSVPAWRSIDPKRGKFCSKTCSYKDRELKMTFEKGHPDLVPKDKRGHNEQARKNISEGGKKRYSDPKEREKAKNRMVGRHSKAHYRKMGLKGIKSQGKSKPTSIEVAVYDELKRLGILFEKQRAIGNRYVVDAFIPSLNLVIECDGDYWHSLPKAIIKDKKKDKYLTDNGFNIIRLPEHKIKSGEFLITLKTAVNQ